MIPLLLPSATLLPPALLSDRLMFIRVEGRGEDDVCWCFLLLAATGSTLSLWPHPSPFPHLPHLVRVPLTLLSPSHLPFSLSPLCLPFTLASFVQLKASFPLNPRVGCEATAMPPTLLRGFGLPPSSLFREEETCFACALVPMRGAFLGALLGNHALLYILQRVPK